MAATSHSDSQSLPLLIGNFSHPHFIAHIPCCSHLAHWIVMPLHRVPWGTSIGAATYSATLYKLSRRVPMHTWVEWSNRDKAPCSRVQRGLESTTSGIRDRRLTNQATTLSGTCTVPVVARKFRQDRAKWEIVYLWLKTWMRPSQTLTHHYCKYIRR